MRTFTIKASAPLKHDPLDGEIKISSLTTGRAHIARRAGENREIYPEKLRSAIPADRIASRRFDCAPSGLFRLSRDLIYDEILTRLVLKSIMNERNELHVRLPFSQSGHSRFPFRDYKGRARELILPELPRSRSPATSLKRTDAAFEHELSSRAVR